MATFDDLTGPAALRKYADTILSMLSGSSVAQAADQPSAAPLPAAPSAATSPTATPSDDDFFTAPWRSSNAAASAPAATASPPATAASAPSTTDDFFVRPEKPAAQPSFTMPASSTPPAPLANTGTTANAPVKHQVSKTARDVLTGLSAPFTMLGDAANAAVNLGAQGLDAAFGIDHVPVPDVVQRGLERLGIDPKSLGIKDGSLTLGHLHNTSDVVQQGLDALGLDKPTNPTERIVSQGVQAMSSVAPLAKAGQVLSSAAPEIGKVVGNVVEAGRAVPSAATGGLSRDAVTQAATASAKDFGDLFSTNLGAQVAGAAGGGMGSQGAQELNLGTGGSLLGGLLGSLVGVGGAAGARKAFIAPSEAADAANALAANPEAAAARTQTATDNVTRDMSRTESRTLAPLDMATTTRGILQELANQPYASPAAALRRSDFRALDIDPTTGQITRDPTQYATEQNMRKAQPALADRFNLQDKQLQSRLVSMDDTPLNEKYQAGTDLIGSLKAIDAQAAGETKAAYDTARASSGAKMTVPTQGLASDYGQILDNYADKIPTAVRNRFERLGLMSGTQRQIFDVEDADQLSKLINSHVGSDPTTNKALGELRAAVNRAVAEADDAGGVFAEPKRLHSARMQQQQDVPALDAAVHDSVSPDKFVDRYIVNGNTDDVVNLANLLRERNPEGFAQARAQLHDSLVKAGFGGGEEFKPATYARALEQIGTAKLSAFYSADEIEQLRRIGRVGYAMRSRPSSSPVNSSNSATELLGLLGSFGKQIPFAGKVASEVGSRVATNRALAGQLPAAQAAVATTNPIPMRGLLPYIVGGALQRAYNQ